jgi:hypothetical protein
MRESKAASLAASFIFNRHVVPIGLSADDIGTRTPF